MEAIDLLVELDRRSYQRDHVPRRLDDVGEVPVGHDLVVLRNLEQVLDGLPGDLVTEALPELLEGEAGEARTELRSSVLRNSSPGPRAWRTEDASSMSSRPSLVLRSFHQRVGSGMVTITQRPSAVW